MPRTASIILMMLMSACRIQDDQADTPALLTNPEPVTIQEIEQAVANATGGSKVTLATDVLTKTSLLVIERTRQQGIDRPQEPGRDLGRPYHFQLVITGSECKLVDRQTGKHWLLIHAECIEEE